MKIEENQFQLKSENSDLKCYSNSIADQNEILQKISEKLNGDIENLKSNLKILDSKLVDKNCTIDAQLGRIDHLGKGSRLTGSKA
jgi:hypothetical protein